MSFVCLFAVLFMCLGVCFCFSFLPLCFPHPVFISISADIHHLIVRYPSLISLDIRHECHSSIANRPISVTNYIQAYIHIYSDTFH